MASYESLKNLEKKLRTKKPEEVLREYIPDVVSFSGNIDEIDYETIRLYLSKDQFEIVKHLVSIIKLNTETLPNKI